MRLSQLITDPPKNKWGPHNFVFPLDSQFSYSNYIKVIYTNNEYHSFSTADGSRDQLDLLNGNRTPSEFVMPEPDNVGKVTIHYRSSDNYLWGISVFDRKGNRLFQTFDHIRADKDHTIELLPGERWVGVKSHAWCKENAWHYDIQIVIMGKWCDENMHI
jgi:hypothetical protein